MTTKRRSAAEVWAMDRPVSRACETCRWAARNRAGARFLHDVLALRAAGRARVSLDAIRHKLNQDYEYEPSMYSLRAHVRGRHEA